MILATLPFRLESSDVEAARRATSGRTISIFTLVVATAGLGAAIGLGLAAMVDRAVDGTRFDEAVPPGLAGWAALAATVVVLAVLGRRADRVTEERTRRPLPEQWMRFDADGLHLLGEHGETFLRWSGVAAVARRGDDFVVSTHVDTILVVPGRALPDPADRAALDALFAAHGFGTAPGGDR